MILKWSQSSMDVVDKYNISYRRTDGFSDALSVYRIISTVNRLLETYTLTGLEENVTYEITITAINTRNSLSTTTYTTTLSGSKKK